MKLKLTAAAAIVALSSTMALADGHANQGYNMLQTALMSDLERLGVDPTSMGDDLTLGEIAAIKQIVDSSESDAQKKGQIEAIIANN